jgi:hypothetical protein
MKEVNCEQAKNEGKAVEAQPVVEELSVLEEENENIIQMSGTDV